MMTRVQYFGIATVSLLTNPITLIQIYKEVHIKVQYLLSYNIDLVNQAQILGEAVSISFYTNILGKGMKPSLNRSFGIAIS